MNFCYAMNESFLYPVPSVLVHVSQSYYKHYTSDKLNYGSHQPDPSNFVELSVIHSLLNFLKNSYRLFMIFINLFSSTKIISTSRSIWSAINLIKQCFGMRQRLVEKVLQHYPLLLTAPPHHDQIKPFSPSPLSILVIFAHAHPARSYLFCAIFSMGWKFQ